jgi:methyl-accepting chemotaxis protein
MKKQSSIERKMLSYFGLIAAASLLITFEFVWAIKAAAPDPKIVAGAVSMSPDAVERLAASLHTLRNKALLMSAVQATVTLIVLIMFMRRITGPLQHIVEKARIISDGDLSQTIRIRSSDEIGLLAETVNGLAGNIQEIVALATATADSVRTDVEKLRQEWQSSPQFQPGLESIEAKLDSFKQVMDDFKLFPAPEPRPEGEEAE